MHPEPYATTRLDALRNLRREGYVVVEREPYLRWRRSTVDDPTCIYHEAEQQRLRLIDAERIITMAAYSGSYEGDMLERMWAEAAAWLDPDDGPRHPGDEFDPTASPAWPSPVPGTSTEGDTYE